MKLFVDGPSLIQIKDLDNLKEIKVDGYTFNPSLYKKIGAKDYINFSKKILEIIPRKPVSIEVIADSYEECFRQAKILNLLGKNVYVKIPITYTDGQSTKKLIKALVSEGLKLNITAIFTIKQIQKILTVIEDTETILSIFAGRIYDIGLDASKKFKEMTDFIHKNSKCKSLWASCRMAYDYKVAKNINADIITMSPDLINKMKLFKKKALNYSRETVIMFCDDAKKAGFKF